MASLEETPKKEENKLDLEGEMTKEYEEVRVKIKLEDLHKSLKKYHDKIKTDKPSFAANLSPEHIQLGDKNKITLSLNNKALDDRDLKYDLLQFLKQDLDNKEISLVTILSEVKIEPKKGPMDEYKVMVEANPKLEDFRKQLDLDF